MHESVSFITFDIKLFLFKQKLLFCLVAIGILQREVDGIFEVCLLQQNLVTLQSKLVRSYSALAMLLDCQILSVIATYKTRLATTVDQSLGICRSQKHLNTGPVFEVFYLKRLGGPPVVLSV